MGERRENEQGPFAWSLENAEMGGIYDIDWHKQGIRSEKSKFGDDAPGAVRRKYLIRSPEGGRYDLEKIELGMSLLEELEDYDIKIPWRAAVQGDKTYIVTEQIRGEDLFEALKHPDGRVVNGYQEVVSNLVRYFSDKVENGGPYLCDIHGQHQFVYGRAEGDNEPNVYLVDLDFDIIEAIPDDELSAAKARIRIKWVAMDMRAAELDSGVRFDRAREEIERAIQGFPEQEREAIRTELEADRRKHGDSPGMVTK